MQMLIVIYNRISHGLSGMENNKKDYYTDYCASVLEFKMASAWNKMIMHNPIATDLN